MLQQFVNDMPLQRNRCLFFVETGWKEDAVKVSWQQIDPLLVSADSIHTFREDVFYISLTVLIHHILQRPHLEVARSPSSFHSY